MDKLNQYREAIQSLLTHYVNQDYCQSNPNIETQLLFDTQRDHYQWMGTGRVKWEV